MKAEEATGEAEIERGEQVRWRWGMELDGIYAEEEERAESNQLAFVLRSFLQAQ